MVERRTLEDGADLLEREEAAELALAAGLLSGGGGVGVGEAA